MKFADSDRDLMHIVDRLKRGVSGLELLEMVQECAGRIELFEYALKINEESEGASLASFLSDNFVFSHYYSEVIIDTYRLCRFGHEVFGDPEHFQSWLFSEVIAMDKRRPIDIIDSFAGRQWIATILGRIEYGVFS